MIIKTRGGYIIKSHKGKKLSRKYSSKDEANKRLREIEYWKHKSNKK